MKQQLEQIRISALEALEAAATPAALEELRVKLLGKKGELTAVLKQMGKLSAEERPVMGQLANNVRAQIEEKLENRKAEIHAAALEAKLAAESIDVTIPGEPVAIGHQHPMNQVLQQIKDIFVGLGYQVVDGPEVELASYNFTRLNIEEGHPSRDRSDTFYFNDDDSVLLRQGKKSAVTFSKGDMVLHKAFGRGLVLTVVPMGGDALLEVAFDGVGTKRLMANTASVHMKKI